MKALIAAFCAVGMSACTPAMQVTHRDSPFGVWSTERGQTVEVRRDGSFRYCDGNRCAAGRYRMDGPHMALLLNFSRMPITQSMLNAAGYEAHPPPWTPLSADDIVRMNSFSLGDGGMSEELRMDLCQGRPCEIIGRAEGDVYRFAKIRDL